jgi:hypothetical protein
VQANFSRAINFHRINFAVVAMHIYGDRTTADFTIFNRRKCSGGRVDHGRIIRTAVGADNMGFYLQFHVRNVSYSGRDGRTKSRFSASSFAKQATKIKAAAVVETMLSRERRNKMK